MSEEETTAAAVDDGPAPVAPSSEEAAVPVSAEPEAVVVDVSKAQPPVVHVDDKKLSQAPPIDVNPDSADFYRTKTLTDCKYLVDRQGYLVDNLHSMKQEIDYFDREVSRLLYCDRVTSNKVNPYRYRGPETLSTDEWVSVRDPGKVFRSRFLARRHGVDVESQEFTSNRYRSLDTDGPVAAEAPVET